MKHISESITESIIGKRGAVRNPYGLTEKDLIGNLEDFPMGVVVRMMEEQEARGNRPNVRIFQENISADDLGGGFEWERTEAGLTFWDTVLKGRYKGRYYNFYLFFKRYPEYKKYNII